MAIPGLQKEVATEKPKAKETTAASDEVELTNAPTEENQAPAVQFELATLQESISEFISKKGDKLTSMQLNILKRSIVIADEHTITFEIVNSIEAEEVEILRNELSPLLRKKFNNDQLTIKHELVTEEDSGNKRLYTAQDKLKYLMEKKPLLKQFKDALGLDPDF